MGGSRDPRRQEWKLRRDFACGVSVRSMYPAEILSAAGFCKYFMQQGFSVGIVGRPWTFARTFPALQNTRIDHSARLS